MKRDQTTITESVSYGAPTITPMDHFIALTAMQEGELIYTLKTDKP